MSVKKRALIVSSDKARLRPLDELSVHPNEQWDISRHETAAGAFAELGRESYDAVISDIMPDMGSMEFLDQVSELHPKAGTIMLFNAEADSLKYIGTAHQLLGIPFDAAALFAALNHASDSAAWTPNETARKLVRGMKILPSPPSLYFRVLREVQSSLQSLENIGWLIARDPAMSAKLLQLANSASMGLRMRVTNTIEAAVYLGSKRIESLLLLAHTFSSFEKVRGFKFNIDAFCQHSTRVSQYAQGISKLEKAGAAAGDSAFTAGLLHDIGKLAIAANYPEQYSQCLEMVKSNGISESEAETSLFGTTHAEMGACMLAAWGLPQTIVEGVARHHNPASDSRNRFSPTIAVHAANALDHVSGSQTETGTLDLAYLATIGLAERATLWKGICRPRDEMDF